MTCVWEEFYKDLKNGIKLLELPVSNLSVFGAVSKEVTTITKQIQLSIKIDKHSVDFPFLVVPDLASHIIVGIDWLDKFQMVIDVENRRLKFMGNFLSDEIVAFSEKGRSGAQIPCKMIHVGKALWY